MVPLDRLSIVTMSLTAAVWPQFATPAFLGGTGRLTCIGSYVNKQVTTFTFRTQATTCSKHHTRTVIRVRSANHSNNWALVLHALFIYKIVINHALFFFITRTRQINLQKSNSRVKCVATMQ